MQEEVMRIWLFLVGYWSAYCLASISNAAESEVDKLLELLVKKGVVTQARQQDPRGVGGKEAGRCGKL